MFQGMEYVYEVYKTRSFSRAAQNLYISQPSLSATIKKIENRIGTPLFDRSTTPISSPSAEKNTSAPWKKSWTLNPDLKITSTILMN